MKATRGTKVQLTPGQRAVAARYLRAEATYAQLAAECGVSRQCVRGWVRAVDPEAVQTVTGLRRAQRIEADALHADIAQARALLAGYRCRLCLGPSVRSVDNKDFITCSPACSRLWPAVRYHLDADYRARHRRTIARWALAHADTVPPAWCRSAKRTLTGTLVERGQWTVMGSDVEGALAEAYALRAAMRRRWGTVETSGQSVPP